MPPTKLKRIGGLPYPFAVSLMRAPNRKDNPKRKQHHRIEDDNNEVIKYGAQLVCLATIRVLNVNNEQLIDFC